MIDRLIHPPMTPDQFQEPRWARFLFASTAAAWLWLVIRLYMAYVFIPAGWGKITSGKWLFGDGSPIQGLVGGAEASKARPAGTCGSSRTSSSPTRACSRRWSRWVSSPSGSGCCVGLMTGIAAFGGVFLNGELHPRRVARVEPGPGDDGPLLVVAWRNAGWIGLDRWFIPWTHRTVFTPKPAEPGSTA